jgi:predicted RNase H-like HicB family nuclease
MRFIAFVHIDPDSCYGVSFPDVPGCTSAGDTLDEALASAVDALSGHIRLIEADGEATPQPRTLEFISADPDFAEDIKGAIISAVPLVRDRGSTTRINVSLDLGLLEAIDGLAKQRSQTRSAFLASAARREVLES